ncbi:MAG: efflux RND transporter permease subunit, partial [Rickettsiales bacterium]|nr:efflux RND transporter permease subunit [Rickettsiales bacterium]
PVIGEIAEGRDMAESLRYHYSDKYRVILMTTIAIVAGMLPQMFSSDGTKVSMGAVLIGGMLGATTWTFLLTPAMFVLMERFREKVLRIRK